MGGLVAPQLEDPDRVGVVNRPVDQVQLAAVHALGAGREELQQLVAPPRLGYKLADHAESDHRCLSGCRVC